MTDRECIIEAALDEAEKSELVDSYMLGKYDIAYAPLTTALVALYEATERKSKSACDDEYDAAEIDVARSRRAITALLRERGLTDE